MNIKTNCPFEKAKIEIVTLFDFDVITASPFPGEEDGFTYSWRNDVYDAK